MKVIAMIFLIGTWSVLTQAQPSRGALVQGSIQGESGSLPTGIVMALYDASNNKLIKTTLTDSTNRFLFSAVQADSVYVAILSGGKLVQQSATITLPKSPTSAVSVPALKLDMSTVTVLTEVEVRSKALFVERRVDRTVINPDALISNAGANALEVLEKSPGVIVDINGNISLQGKPGVQVFMDDKPTYLSSADLANYLRSLPASTIAQVEIMTNPPAKYDAAGSAGIINIRTKKLRTLGFNGGFNTSYGQGVYARNTNSIQFNYRINKFNFFSNLSYSRNNSFQDLTIERNYFTPAGIKTSGFNQRSYIKTGVRGMNGRIGVDYYASKKSILGIVIGGVDNLVNTTTDNRAQTFDGTDVLSGKVDAFNRSKRTLRNISINGNYTYRLNNKGRELAVNADYLRYNGMTIQGLRSSNYDASGSLQSGSNLLSDLPSNIRIHSIKADFTNPLPQGAKFEAGGKLSWVSTSNIAAFVDEVNGILTPNFQFSNNFSYEERISAAYANYNFSRKRWSIQTGLRLEHTNISGNQLGNALQNDSSFKRNYANLFPTLYILYRADSLGRHMLGINTGRRITRPDYQSMNPFTYPIDRFTLYAGNPFLNPALAYTIELSHTYRGRITTAVVLGFSCDVINETIQQTNGVFYSRPGNFGRQFNMGLTHNGMYPIRKWWTLQLYSELMYNKFTSTVYGQNLNNQGTYWFIGPTNQFSMTKKWSAEIAGTYQTSVNVGQFVTVPVWSIRFGISRKILHDKGTLKLSMNDVFYTNRPGGDIQAIENSTANWRSILDTRVATLAFSYRFSKGKNLSLRNTGGTDAEKSRIKS